MQINIEIPCFITSNLNQELTSDNQYLDYIDTTTKENSVTSQPNTIKKPLKTKTKKQEIKSEYLNKFDKEIQELEAYIEHWEQNGCINDLLRDDLASKKSIKTAYIKKCKKLGIKP